MSDTPSRRALLHAAGAAALAAPACAQTPAHGHQPLTTSEKERQAFKFMALKVFVEVDSKDTKGAVAVMRIFVPPGAGAAPHIHSREDEVFTVVRGHYRFRHGDMEVDAPPGTVVFLPRGEAHTFKNVSNEPGEHTVTAVPGGLEGFFRDVSAAQIEMPRDSEKLFAIGAKYGLTHLPPASLPLSAG